MTTKDKIKTDAIHAVKEVASGTSLEVIDSSVALDMFMRFIDQAYAAGRQEERERCVDKIQEVINVAIIADATGGDEATTEAIGKAILSAIEKL